MVRNLIFAIFALGLAAGAPTPACAKPEPALHWAAVRAPDREARTRLVNQGFAIDNVVEDMSYGMASPKLIDELKAKGFEITAHFPREERKILDFPREDAIYHNYAEMNAALDELAKQYPRLVRKISIGQSIEGREIMGVRLGAGLPEGLTPSGLPGSVLMGGHHAREHLSMEIPLLLAQHLAKNYASDATVKRLLDTRDIFILPMINPDGAEYDIADGIYKGWRKNRRVTGEHCDGVDLNRNYGFHWGQGGSSPSSCAETYMGESAFSEPETRAVKAFLEGHPNIKTLLTYHTYSELILYPWGYTYDRLANAADLSMFETMGQAMARWNGYTPQPSSELYITTGDTVDWAYGTLGIAGFTFELSPKHGGWFGGTGGFYPGADAIATTFAANIKPALYLIDLADDPHRAVNAPQTTLFYGAATL